MPKINREEVKNEIYRLKRHQVEGAFSFFGPLEAVSLNQVIEIIDNAEPIEEYEGESEETEVKDNEWAIKEIEDLETESSQNYPHDEMIEKEIVLSILDQLDEPETLSQGYNQQAYRDGFKEGERQTAEYFENITEEPSKEQVWKYLSEHGIEVVEKEPETVASVLDDFYKSLERMKEMLNMEIEELEG